MNRAAQITARDNHRVWFIRQRWTPARVRCERCADEVQTLTPEEAAAFARTEVAAVLARLEFGEIHRAETAEGSPLICLNSLTRI
jgi:hypothetical protein